MPTVQLLKDGLMYLKKQNKKMTKIDHLILKNIKCISSHLQQRY